VRLAKTGKAQARCRRKLEESQKDLEVHESITVPSNPSSSTHQRIRSPRQQLAEAQSRLEEQSCNAGSWSRRSRRRMRQSRARHAANAGRELARTQEHSIRP